MNNFVIKESVWSTGVVMKGVLKLKMTMELKMTNQTNTPI